MNPPVSDTMSMANAVPTVPGGPGLWADDVGGRSAADWMEQLKRYGDVACCLPVVLLALGWSGTARQLAEVMPTDRLPLDLTDVGNVMIRLGFSSEMTRGSLRRPGPGGPPVVFVPDGEPAFVVLEFGPRACTVFQPGRDLAEDRPRTGRPGTVLRFAPLPRDEGTASGAAAGARRPWFWKRVAPMRGFLALTFVLAALVNLLALGNPLVVMAVYDHVIAAGDTSLLAFLMTGGGVGLALEFGLRRLRSTTTSYCGARLSYIVGNAIFNQLLNLPSLMTERASIGAQVARVRDLERVRELLTGPLAQACLDLPFTLLFIIAMAVLGGWLALVPLGAMLAYALFALAVAPRVRTLVAEAARANARRQELTLETLDKMRALRVTGADDIWLDRYRELSLQAARANFRNAHFASFVLSVGQGLTMIAGVATMAAGIHLVLAGALTTGGLIGSMIMVWRVLAPMQGAFVTTTRIGQLLSSIRQIDSLMGMPSERPDGLTALPVRDVRGRVAFNRVTFRYGRESDPVLSNVTFEVEPGDLVAIVGRNGAGKSSVLKLVAGLYQPQVGNVRLENRDLRQFHPIELRRLIAYVPQMPHLFHGTIADNLRMAEPMATEERILEAIDMAGATEAMSALPNGIHTLVDSRNSGMLPTSLLTRLSLARAYVKRAPLILFDEPITGLDFESEFAFVSALETLRGRSTVFIVTHRPGHLRIADKVLLLDDGMVRFYGPAAKVIDRIPPGLM